MLIKSVKSLFIGLVVVFSSYATLAQKIVNLDLKWVVFDKNENLPTCSYINFHQTKDSTCWVANNYGVAWYNNYNWQQLNIFKTDVQNIKNIRFKFEEDNTGRLFFNYYDTIYALQKKHYKKVLFQIDQKPLRILDFAIDKHNNFLLLTIDDSRKHISLYKTIGKKAYKIWESFEEDIAGKSTLHKTHYGHVFFKVKNEIYAINGFKLNNIGLGLKKEMVNVSLLEEDSSGRFYLQLREGYNFTYHYYLHWDGKQYKIQNYTLPFEKNVVSNDVDINGNELFLTKDNNFYLKRNNTWFEVSIPSHLKNCNFAKFDLEGDIWIGNNNKMIRYTTNNNLFTNVRLGANFNDNIVNSICVDKQGYVWIAEANKIVKLNPDYSIAQEFNINPAITFTCVNIDDQNNIWVGSGQTNNSTYRYNGKKWELMTSQNGFIDAPIHKILKNKDGSLLFLCLNNNGSKEKGSGLYQLKNNLLWVKQYDNVPKDVRIYSYLETKDGTIWIGTLKGLYKIQNKQVTYINKVDSNDIVRVMDLVEDKKGIVYFNTNSIGLCKILPNNKVEKLNTPIIFDFSQITSDLLVDQDNILWITSPSSLWAFKNDLFFEYKTETGLPYPTCWPVVANNNDIIVGTLGAGISIIHKNNFIQKEPLVTISIIQENENKPVLLWNYFAYRKPFNDEELLFSYQIDNGRWSHFTNKRTIDLGQIKPGKHLMHYKIKNEFSDLITDVYSNEQIIFIAPPFYLNTWFIIPIGMLTLALFIIVFVYFKERNQNYHVILANEKKLSSLINSMPFKTIVLNKDGHCIHNFVNDKNSLFTFAKNNDFIEEFDNVNKSLMLQSIANCLSTKSKEIFTYHETQKDNFYEITFSPYDDLSDNQLVTAVIIDITDKIKNIAELEQAKIVAESADKAKMIFLSNMSHEIRTPMNAIMGIADIMLDERMDDNQKDNLIIIKRSAENLVIIINDILDISKIEAGRIEFEKIEFSLPDLLEQVCKTLQLKAEKKGIALSYLLDAQAPPVIIGDPTRMSQILINLVGNAIKFTHKGFVKLHVNAIHKNEQTVNLRFSIIDSGVGIAKDKLETIFESFSQENIKVTRKYGGTGLGLTISKRLCELQGGNISVTSEVDHGSIFTVQIPFEFSDLIEINNKQKNNLKDLKGLKILVVEDNQINQILAKQLLTKWQIEVDMADNGLIALEKLKLKNYDLILMDLQMPEMDGYETTIAIRSGQINGIDKNIPVIALTADAFAETKKQALLTGMNDFVTKPFKQDELFLKISKHAFNLT
ncbi:MAG: response regulator [Bacteroidota bacterium]